HAVEGEPAEGPVHRGRPARARAGCPRRAVLRLRPGEPGPRERRDQGAAVRGHDRGAERPPHRPGRDARRPRAADAPGTGRAPRDAERGQGLLGNGQAPRRHALGGGGRRGPRRAAGRRARARAHGQDRPAGAPARLPRRRLAPRAGGRRRGGGRQERDAHAARGLPGGRGRGGVRARARRGRAPRRGRGGAGVSHWRAVREVAAWEFRRFLRVRELLTTIVVVAVMAGPLPAAIGYMARRDAESAVTLAVPPGAGLAEASRFRFVELPPDEAASALERGEVDGILDLTDPAAPSLVVPRDPRWADALAAALGQRALQARLAEVGVTPDELSALGAPVPLEVNVTGSSRSSGVWPLVVISGFMLTLVSTGTALLFTAITGEKTQRVTELVLSAISPQAWIDGKVLGTGLSVLVNVLAFGLGIGLAL